MYLEFDNVDEKVYNNLIRIVNSNMDSLYKYIDLRKKVLKLDKVYLYDMFVFMVKVVDNNINYEKV